MLKVFFLYPGLEILSVRPKAVVATLEICAREGVLFGEVHLL